MEWLRCGRLARMLSNIVINETPSKMKAGRGEEMIFFHMPHGKGDHNGNDDRIHIDEQAGF